MKRRNRYRRIRCSCGGSTTTNALGRDAHDRSFDCFVGHFWKGNDGLGALFFRLRRAKLDPEKLEKLEAELVESIRTLVQGARETNVRFRKWREKNEGGKTT